MRRLALRRWAWLILIALCALGCSEPSGERAGGDVSGQGPSGRPLARLVTDGIFRADRAWGQPLAGPSECVACHPEHVQEWRGGPHAFSAVDGVFDDMHRRGQAESGGALEGFCFDCHAPAARLARAAQVRRRCLEFTGRCEPEEVETSATDSADLGAEAGVTCAVCHEVGRLHGLENAEIGLRRGRLLLDDPPAHERNLEGWLAWPSFDPEVQAPLRDACEAWEACALDDLGAPSGEPGETLRQGALCGACHQVTSPRGVAVEETFTEWLDAGLVATGQGCVDCHMPVIPPGDGAERSRHRHGFTGVDVPLDPARLAVALAPEVTPERYIDAERSRVQAELEGAASLEISAAWGAPDGPTLDVAIANQTGHHLPTGATQERELWVRVRAFADDAPAPYWTRGDVAGVAPLPDGFCARWDEEDDGLRCLEQHPYEPGLRVYRSVFFRLAEHVGERAVILEALRAPRLEDAALPAQARERVTGLLRAAGISVREPLGVASNPTQAFWDHFAAGDCDLSFSSIYYRQPEEGEPNYAFKSRRVADLYRGGRLDRGLLEALRELTFTKTSSGSRTLFVDTAEAAARPEADLRWNVLPGRRRALGHDLLSVRAPLPTPELVIPVDFPWDADGNMRCTLPAGGVARERITMPTPPAGTQRVRLEVALLFRAFPPDFLRALSGEALLGEGSHLTTFTLAAREIELERP